MKFELPKLAYSYDALEPYMDAKTVEIHYSKHHATYVNNLNVALEKYPNINYNTLYDLLLNIDKLPEDIRSVVKNSGGGHLNHSLFWEMLTPNKTQPSEEVLEAINKNFGSFEEFKNKFETAGSKHFGSGWVWLLKNGDKLEIISLPNQDAPVGMGKILLGIDLWEHAYYLKYQNRRMEYLQNIWNIVNWDYINKAFKD